MHNVSSFKFIISLTQLDLTSESIHIQITQDRNGQPTDQTFLQSLSNFFNEVGGKTRPFCYNKFEEAILVDTGNYYSQVAPEWLLNYSSAEYAFKVHMLYVLFLSCLSHIPFIFFHIKNHEKYFSFLHVWIGGSSFNFQAEQCLREERGRASKILHRPGVEKLLQVF